MPAAATFVPAAAVVVPGEAPGPASGSALAPAAAARSASVRAGRSRRPGGVGAFGPAGPPGPPGARRRLRLAPELPVLPVRERLEVLVVVEQELVRRAGPDVSRLRVEPRPGLRRAAGDLASLDRGRASGRLALDAVDVLGPVLEPRQLRLVRGVEDEARALEELAVAADVLEDLVPAHRGEHAARRVHLVADHQHLVERRLVALARVRDGLLRHELADGGGRDVRLVVEHVGEHLLVGRLLGEPQPLGRVGLAAQPLRERVALEERRVVRLLPRLRVHRRELLDTRPIGGGQATQELLLRRARLELTDLPRRRQELALVEDACVDLLLHACLLGARQGGEVVADGADAAGVDQQRHPVVALPARVVLVQVLPRCDELLARIIAADVQVGVAARLRARAADGLGLEFRAHVLEHVGAALDQGGDDLLPRLLGHPRSEAGSPPQLLDRMLPRAELVEDLPGRQTLLDGRQPRERVVRSHAGRGGRAALAAGARSLARRRAARVVGATGPTLDPVRQRTPAGLRAVDRDVRADGHPGALAGPLESGVDDVAQALEDALLPRLLVRGRVDDARDAPAHPALDRGVDRLEREARRAPLERHRDLGPADLAEERRRAAAAEDGHDAVDGAQPERAGAVASEEVEAVALEGLVRQHAGDRRHDGGPHERPDHERPRGAHGHGGDEEADREADDLRREIRRRVAHLDEVLERAGGALLRLPQPLGLRRRHLRVEPRDLDVGAHLAPFVRQRVVEPVPPAPLALDVLLELLRALERVGEVAGLDPLADATHLVGVERALERGHRLAGPGVRRWLALLDRAERPPELEPLRVGRVVLDQVVRVVLVVVAEPALAERQPVVERAAEDLVELAALAAADRRVLRQVLAELRALVVPRRGEGRGRRLVGFQHRVEGVPVDAAERPELHDERVVEHRVSDGDPEQRLESRVLVVAQLAERAREVERVVGVLDLRLEPRELLARDARLLRLLRVLVLGLRLDRLDLTPDESLVGPGARGRGLDHPDQAVGVTFRRRLAAEERPRLRRVLAGEVAAAGLVALLVVLIEQDHVEAGAVPRLVRGANRLRVGLAQALEQEVVVGPDLVRGDPDLVDRVHLAPAEDRLRLVELVAAELGLDRLVEGLVAPALADLQVVRVGVVLDEPGPRRVGRALVVGILERAVDGLLVRAGDVHREQHLRERPEATPVQVVRRAERVGVVDRAPLDVLDQVDAVLLLVRRLQLAAPVLVHEQVLEHLLVVASDVEHPEDVRYEHGQLGPARLRHRLRACRAAGRGRRDRPCAVSEQVRDGRVPGRMLERQDGRRPRQRVGRKMLQAAGLGSLGGPGRGGVFGLGLAGTTASGVLHSPELWQGAEGSRRCPNGATGGARSCEAVVGARRPARTRPEFRIHRFPRARVTPRSHVLVLTVWPRRRLGVYILDETGGLVAQTATPPAPGDLGAGSLAVWLGRSTRPGLSRST